MKFRLSVFLIFLSILSLAVLAQDIDPTVKKELTERRNKLAQFNEPDTGRFMEQMRELRDIAVDLKFGRLLSASYFDPVTYFSIRGDMDCALEALEEFRVASERDTLIDQVGLYTAWTNLVQNFDVHGSKSAALRELNRMHEYAERKQNNFGLGESFKMYGFLHSSASYDEALANYHRAVEYMSKSAAPAQCCHIYYLMAMVCQKAGRLHEALDYAIKSYDTAVSYSFLSHSLAICTQLSIYIDLNDRANARRCYNYVDSLWRNNLVNASAISESAKTMAVYHCRFGNPDDAQPYLPHISERYDSLDAARQYHRAKGEFRLAADMAEQMVSVAENRAREIDETRMAEANAAFNTQQLEREKHEAEMLQAKSQNQRNFALGLLSLLAVICASLFLLHRNTLHKNRELVRRIRAQEEAEQQMLQEQTAEMANAIREAETAAADMADDSASNTQRILFLRITQLLSDEKILTQSDLGRDTIASLLGTNRTYVAQAIAACAGGKSVSEYVNAHRIQYARCLLDAYPSLSIDQIVDRAGFSSRSRFHHIFQDTYGMTPRQYRMAQ